jgi:type I restriction enzyme R subunit
MRAVRYIRENKGKLGVFWHTQGSGKSFSMMFLAQKMLRKLGGHWTFLIVSDRADLDDQIYRNFARCGVVSEGEKQVRAQDGQHLKRLLREDHRYVFTLIQKFHTRDGRGPPQPVRHAGDEYAPGPAQGRLYRLHRHPADGRRGGADARGVWRVRQHL